jgi:hypothetical protein
MQIKKTGTDFRVRKLEQTAEQESWHRQQSKEAGTDCRAGKIE